MGAGAALALSTPLKDLDSGAVAFAALGVAGAMAVVIAGWTTSNPTLYRAGLALQAVTPNWPRWKVTLMAGVVTTIIACFPFVFTKLLTSWASTACFCPPGGGRGGDRALALSPNGPSPLLDRGPGASPQRPGARRLDRGHRPGPFPRAFRDASPVPLLRTHLDPDHGGLHRPRIRTGERAASEDGAGSSETPEPDRPRARRRAGSTGIPGCPPHAAEPIKSRASWPWSPLPLA